MADQVVGDLATVLGMRAACKALGHSRAGYYRRHRTTPPRPRRARERKPQPRALSPAERSAVLGVLHEERFVDQAPASIYAELLDEGRYLCSVPTMYRVLRAEEEVRERRRQATHPAHVKPELVAYGPNQTWSWDITKLLGPHKWTYYYLYVVIDIFSRYIPGWLLATRESAELAERFLAETIRKHDIVRDQLTIHSDRGTARRWRPRPWRSCWLTWV
jgi:putative transposase